MNSAEAWTLEYFIELVLFILPAYVSNAFPVIVYRFSPWRKPLDFGRRFFDGKRILGDHKTIDGFIGGVLMGILTSYVLSLIGYHDILKGAVLSIGAMVGDSLGSFVKRRLNLPPGSSLPLVDQLSFILFALLVYGAIWGINALSFIILLLLTFPLHIATNFIAYLLKLKSTPF